jgi:hypothetical protein
MLGIGVVFVPLAAVSAALHEVVLEVPIVEDLVELAEPQSLVSASIALLVGSAGNLVAFVVVQAAVATMLDREERGTGAGLVEVHRLLRDRGRGLASAVAREAAVIALLLISVVGIPWAVHRLVAWCLVVQACVLEGRDGPAALRRSAALVRGRWWSTAATIALINAVGLASGPVVGIVLLFVSDLPLLAINLVGSAVYAVTVPYVAIATTLLWGDRVTGRVSGGRG